MAEPINLRGDGPAEADGGIVPETDRRPDVFYCPECSKPVEDPLRCRDCGSLICRDCGMPLELASDLGIG